MQRFNAEFISQAAYSGSDTNAVNTYAVIMTPAEFNEFTDNHQPRAILMVGSQEVIGRLCCLIDLV
jgi:hypothetical protein